MGERLLTVAEVCRLSGRARNTVKLWMSKGELSSVISHGKRVIPLSEFTRVFPDVPGTAIEAELNQVLSDSQEVSVAPKAIDHDTVIRTVPDERDALITSLRHQLEQAQQMVEMQAAMIEMLKADKETLTAQLSMKDHQIESLTDQFGILGRLIPQVSSAKAARPLPPSLQRRRDPRSGRFLKTESEADSE